MPDDESNRTHARALIDLEIAHDNFYCLSAFIAAISILPLYAVLPVAILIFLAALKRAVAKSQSNLRIINLKLPPSAHLLRSSEVPDLLPFVRSRSHIKTISFPGFTVISYPDHYEESPPENLRASILHELGHQNRLDVWFAVIGVSALIKFVLWPFQLLFISPSFYESNIIFFPPVSLALTAYTAVYARRVLHKREYVADFWAWDADRTHFEGFLRSQANIEILEKPSNWIAAITDTLWHPRFSERLSMQRGQVRIPVSRSFRQAAAWSFGIGLMVIFLSLQRNLPAVLQVDAIGAWFAPLAAMVGILAVCLVGISLQRIQSVSVGHLVAAGSGYALGLASCLLLTFLIEDLWATEFELPLAFYVGCLITPFIWVIGVAVIARLLHFDKIWMAISSISMMLAVTQGTFSFLAVLQAMPSPMSWRGEALIIAMAVAWAVIIGSILVVLCIIALVVARKITLVIIAAIQRYLIS